MISRKTKTWITKAINIHGDIYDYSLVEYTRSKDKVNINCKIHGVFEQRASNHLVGRGCPECGNTLNSISSNRKRVDRFTNKQENMNRIYDCGNLVFQKSYNIS